MGDRWRQDVGVWQQDDARRRPPRQPATRRGRRCWNSSATGSRRLSSVPSAARPPTTSERSPWSDSAHHVPPIGLRAGGAVPCPHRVRGWSIACQLQTRPEDAAPRFPMCARWFFPVELPDAVFVGGDVLESLWPIEGAPAACELALPRPPLPESDPTALVEATSEPAGDRDRRTCVERGLKTRQARPSPVLGQAVGRRRPRWRRGRGRSTCPRPYDLRRLRRRPSEDRVCRRNWQADRCLDRQAHRVARGSCTDRRTPCWGAGEGSEPRYVWPLPLEFDEQGARRGSQP